MISVPSGLVRRHRWAAGALLGLAGLLLNAFPVNLSPGIDLIFGGVAYLLAAVVLGPGPGLLAAGIASVRTFWLWGHPWAWLIFSLEGLVVGYLFVRWNRRPLTATALYWLVLGVPLLFLTYWGVIGMRGTTLTIIALKQPLNGLVNAVVVEALLLLGPVRRMLRIPAAPRLRSAIAVIVLLSSLVPALVFGVWAGRREWSRSVELAQGSVEYAAAAYASKLELYIELHKQSIRSMAELIQGGPGLDPQRIQRLISADLGEFSGFLNLYVGDSRGVALAFAPRGRPSGELIGLDFSDREYFRQLRELRTTVVSDVFLGRGGAEVPMVVIGHPIVQADTFAGYLIGALDLNGLPAPTATSAQPERLRVADGAGNLVFDSGAPYRTREPVRSVAQTDFFERIRAQETHGVTVIQQASASVTPSVVAAQVMVGYAPLPAIGWWVWADYPFRLIEASVAVPYARLLAFLVAAVILTGILSSLLAGWMAAPLLRLRWAAAALASGNRGARVRRLPRSVPREIAELASGFDEMADTLQERAEELEELSEITRSLASTLESEALLRQITDAAVRLLQPDGCGIALLDAERRTLRAAEYSLGLLKPTAGREIPVESSLIGWVVRHEEPVRVGAVSTDTRVYRAGVDLEGIGSVVCAPLVGRSGVLGTLTAVRGRDHPAPFVADDLRLLERLAGTAAIAVENARLIEQAQAASRAKSDFIAATSHELRTPLNAVLGHLQLLELEIHGKLTPEQRNAIVRIGAATRHLRSLIEEVLSFARLEAGRAEVRLSEVDVGAIVGDVAAVIEPLAWEKKLRFRLELPERTVSLHTDPDKVRQILINLAGNAVKFTDVGEVCLEVEPAECGSAAAGDGDAPGVTVRVADTGPGISEEDRARLFRPFEQLESGLSRRHGGTGLGLYLSGQYAKLIGGRIEVSSELGGGSVFSLILPCDPAVDGAAATDEPARGA